MGKKLRDVLNILLLVLVFLCLIFVLSLSKEIFKFLKGEKEYINIYGYTPLNIISGSMEPELSVGDLIIVKLFPDKESLNVGDIITFKDEKLVTHRIIDKKENYVITKGDYNNKVDDPVEYEKIIGVLHKKISKFGIYLYVIKQPQVIIPFISSIFLIIIAVNINLDDESKKCKNT